MAVLQQFITMMFGESAPTRWEGGMLFLCKPRNRGLFVVDESAIPAAKKKGRIEFSWGAGSDTCDAKVQYYVVDYIAGTVPKLGTVRNVRRRESIYIPNRYADYLTGRAVTSMLELYPTHPTLCYLAGTGPHRSPGWQ